MVLGRSARGERRDPDFPLDAVPQSSRRSPAGLFVLLVSFFFFTPTMLAGGQTSVGFTFSNYLGIALIAAVILAVYAALMGVISSRSGLSTVLITKACMGRVGGKWSALLLGGTQVGWFAVTLATLSDLIGRALSLEVTWPLVLVFGVVTATAAYRGAKGLEMLGWVAIPLLLALCIWVTQRAIGDIGGWGELMATEPVTEISVGSALTVLVGTFVSGSTQVGNWSRFSRTDRGALISIFVAVIVAQYAMYFFGGLGSAAYGEPDFVLALYEMGLVAAGAGLLLVALWTTNENTAYAFGVAGSELFGVNDKRPFVAGGAALGVVFALTGIYESLSTFLILLGTFVPPLGGAIMGQFYLVWRGRLPAHHLTDAGGLTALPVVRVSCVAAYLLGTAAAGTGAAFDLGIPAVQGIVVAALAAPLCHVLLSRWRKTLPREVADSPATDAAAGKSASGATEYKAGD
ncbi:cytosine permease [Prauserella alba]|uniref:Cytosine permease n=1 Tax=Prauserella alba TaxID=176898 RepID=A0ABP4FY40_9PSEU|nr:cytosine permease [Prauserella alba]MCP2181792.1 cytosine permease [Prauserella alba]